MDPTSRPAARSNVRASNAARSAASSIRDARPRGRTIWTTEGEPPLLDDEGFELVLVGVDDEPERELGIDVLGHPVDHAI